MMEKVSVNVEQLRPTEPGLYAKLIDLMKKRGIDPAKVKDTFVEMDEDHEDEALRDLQIYVKTEAEMKRVRQQREQREQQRVRDDEQAAYVYWQKQVEAGVMLDSQKNRDAVIAYLSEHNQLPSVATIQAALMALHETLEKPEVLGTLPNGEKQLPTDASESEMKRASVQQLRDLSARRFQGKSRPAGSFGGRF
jgi:hypothetical protein